MKDINSGTALVAWERYTDERALHSAIAWFVMKWAPKDGRTAAEFHADFIRVVQAIHADAARPVAEILKNALAALPPIALHSAIHNRKEHP